MIEIVNNIVHYLCTYQISNELEASSESYSGLVKEKDYKLFTNPFECIEAVFFLSVLLISIYFS